MNDMDKRENFLQKMQKLATDTIELSEFPHRIGTLMYRCYQITDLIDYEIKNSEKENFIKEQIAVIVAAMQDMQDEIGVSEDSKRFGRVLNLLRQIIEEFK